MPVSGENANIPTMWTLMTNPMTCRPASPCDMWSGVITMTLTMTTCPSAIASMPRRAAGIAATTRSPRVIEPCAAPVSSPSAMRRRRASTRGSGRRRTARNATAVNSRPTNEKT